MSRLLVVLALVAALAVPASAAFKVIYAGTEGDNATLRANIVAASGGMITSVDFRNSATAPCSSSVWYQAGYRVIITYGGNYFYGGGAAWGDGLASFVDSGGGALNMTYTTCAGGNWCLGGRYVSQYCPVPTVSYGGVSGQSMTILQPSHPIMAGVSSITGFTCEPYTTTLRSATYGVRIANWSTSGYVQCAAFDSGGKRTVFLGYHPNYNMGGGGQWLTQLVNALIWMGNPSTPDVGVRSLLAPVGNVDSGTVVTPACSVYNYGNTTPASYKVRLRIGTLRVDSATVTSHAPGTAVYVTFPTWTATPRGLFGVSCSTELTGDVGGSNNKKADSVRVNVKDVGVTALAVPLAGATYPRDTVISPKATWRNYGSQVASFEAWMLLADPTDARVYSKKVDVPGLAVGGSLEVPFPVCTLKTAGAWTARCSSYLVGDQIRANDTINRSFTVAGSTPPPSGGWRPGRLMPLTPSGKPVKAGGWLCYDTLFRLCYGAKGNKTGDFYSYSLPGDSWHQRASIPPGTESKLPSKGAKGCAAMAGFLYATKGSNTQGYWMYDIAKDSWYQRKDVPLGRSNKKVKGGTDIIYAMSKGLGYAYLLKGYKNEFWKYDPRGDAWIELPDAPVGANMKWDKGSWIAYDGLRTLFAHKAKYHEFYSFDTDKDSWNMAPLAPMPTTGSNGTKKSKDGGCGTYDKGFIYALKGGNTNEFWRYEVAVNRWVELETMPKVHPAEPKAKKVGQGADLTTAPMITDLPGVPAEIPALKGNGTNQTWIYSPVFYAPDVRNEGALACTGTAGQPGFSLAPNPLAGGQLLVRYALPVTGVAQVRVYDVSGQSVLPVSSIYGRTGTLALDVTNLSAGVYLVKLEAGSFASVRKLVIDR